MRIQNIFRMQAIVIGLGAALFLASSTPAQEIVNTPFNDGPYVISFDQSGAVTPAAAQASTLTGSSNAVTPAIEVSTPVVVDQALISYGDSAERWLVVSSLCGIAMLAVYAVAEVRRASRHLSERPSSPLQRRAVLS